MGQELVVVTTAWTDEASNHQNEVRTITAVNGQWLDVGIRDHLLSSSLDLKSDVVCCVFGKNMFQVCNIYMYKRHFEERFFLFDTFQICEL